jgi:hypothetical protein
MERRYNEPYYSDYEDEESPPEEKEEKGIMATWFSRERVQLAATAVVSGAVVAGAILGYQHVRRQERVEDLKRGIPAVGDGHEVDKVRLPLYRRGRTFGLMGEN